MQRRRSITTRLRCPQCGREIAWAANPHRPFCSLGCRPIDLGVWLDERYCIPGAEFPVVSSAADRSE
ncbi:MAG TPA: DNA gyrase inhibitor YacG [Candidatus Methylomirabilis sp.]|nr:DNA gyrase inhibitor YacG [Candidatus Methylomirabilis sp.]